MDFHISLDPQSLSEITQLQGFAGLLNPAVQKGLEESGILLVNTTVANTWNVFANPTGKLADSIYFYVISPTEVAVAVGVPYGQRRERGFSGMTDALGRYYPNDPAKPYAQPAVDQTQQEIQEIMEMAVNSALGRIAA
jgi:hypothetical protein